MFFHTLPEGKNIRTRKRSRREIRQSVLFLKQPSGLIVRLVKQISIVVADNEK